jgi:type III restriction enzyme
MITVGNRTETAARVKYAFDHKRVRIDELCDPGRILHIDSKVLEQAEAQEEPLAEVELTLEEGEGAAPRLTRKQQAELLRRMVDTIGRAGEPGEKVQSVISVGMLSEGWDAKTVTHIMGLRAFSSQLLCEQVVGRGLRRTSYEVNPETGLFDPEYVNIFGVPFTFLPHEGGDGPPPPSPSPKTAIEPDPAKAQYEIRWPNVVRIDHVYRPTLSLDWNRLRPLELDAARTAQVAELAPILEGKPDVTQVEHRARTAGERVPDPADNLRDGAGRLRPDAAHLEGEQGSAAGAAGAPGGAIHPRGQDRRPPAAVLSG